MNIAIIVMDSLRFDVSQESNLINISRYGNFEKVYSHGTYTLSSHISLFRTGALPYSTKKGSRYWRKGKKFFKIELPWEEQKDVVYRLPAKSTSIVKGFERLGYRTVCIGGVHCWDSEFETSKIWSNYFQEVYWHPNFAEEYDNSFDNQIRFAGNLKLEREPLLFFFINIATTHSPYLGEISIKGQVRSFEYIDKKITELFNLFPKPIHVFLLSDHGDCIGEDGFYGHGFYHKKVMEVPMMDFILE